MRDEGLDELHKGEGVPPIGHGGQQELRHLLGEGGAQQRSAHSQQDLVTGQADRGGDAQTRRQAALTPLWSTEIWAKMHVCVHVL